MDKVINIGFLTNPVNWLVVFAVWFAAAYLVTHVSYSLPQES